MFPQGPLKETDAPHSLHLQSLVGGPEPLVLGEWDARLSSGSSPPLSRTGPGGWSRLCSL